MKKQQPKYTSKPASGIKKRVEIRPRSYDLFHKSGTLGLVLEALEREEIDFHVEKRPFGMGPEIVWYVDEKSHRMYFRRLDGKLWSYEVGDKSLRRHRSGIGDWYGTYHDLREFEAMRQQLGVDYYL